MYVGILETRNSLKNENVFTQTALQPQLAKVTVMSDPTFDFGLVNQHHHHAQSGQSGGTGQDAQAPAGTERANDSDRVCTAESAMVKRNKFSNGKIGLLMSYLWVSCFVWTLWIFQYSRLSPCLSSLVLVENWHTLLCHLWSGLQL